MLAATLSPGSVLRSKRRLLLLALVASMVGSSRAQQPVVTERPVRDILQSHDKWLFAFTGRLPLDPFESWNQFPATTSRDGDGLTLNVLSPHKGTVSVYALKIQADGSVFEYTGYGQVFMRLDSADPRAPFKGQVGDNTYWLLRAR